VRLIQLATLAIGSLLLAADAAQASCQFNIAICKAICGRACCDDWSGVGAVNPSALRRIGSEDLRKESHHMDSESDAGRVLDAEIARREGPSGPQIRGIEATPSRPAVRPQDALDPKRVPALEPTPPKSGKPVSKEYQPLPTKGSGRIPTHSKEWTDHNIHDPGQTTLPESDESRTRKKSQEDD
jgi:hypothetical protein